MKIRLVQISLVFFVVISFVFSTVSYSQSLSEPKGNLESTHLNSLTPNNTRFSLLDLSRLKIRNSYTVSYLSSGNRSGSFGLFVTSFEYQLSNPLNIQVDLGYLHQPFSMGRNNIDINSRILPNVRVNYSPSPYFNLSVNFMSMGNQYRYYPEFYEENR
ncbi:MAG: hypothetical protein RBG1_1C00001G0309 [candidate division Zixibacteria bacterium RBG-1]|nr:MAG: hypothetical protein RBG1_1C00001G0309 [candidate division Zixibacteria bacterium RBG-1]